jgi:hypothetical protein
MDSTRQSADNLQRTSGKRAKRRGFLPAASDYPALSVQSVITTRREKESDDV